MHWAETPEECQTGWMVTEKLWVGFLITDGILAELNGTANFDDRTSMTHTYI